MFYKTDFDSVCNILCVLDSKLSSWPAEASICLMCKGVQEPGGRTQARWLCCCFCGQLERMALLLPIDWGKERCEKSRISNLWPHKHNRNFDTNFIKGVLVRDWTVLVEFIIVTQDHTPSLTRLCEKPADKYRKNMRFSGVYRRCLWIRKRGEGV